MKHISIPLIFCLGFTTQVSALDQIATHDGGMITGVIKHISEDSIVVSTDYAGDITLQRNKVIGFTSGQPLSVRLHNGTTFTGPVQHQEKGTLSITSADTGLVTQFKDIAESWSPTEQDPQRVRLEQQRQAELRKWTLEAGLGISGKKGNSDQSALALIFAAELKGKDDSLKFYGSVDQQEQEGEDSADEIILGSEYTAYYLDPWGWYARAEAEQDDFENLDLRTLVGAGLNYRVFNRAEHTLELRSGLGYRHERFSDGTQEQSPTLDFGLAHNWLFADWGRMKNNLTYAPAIDDFKDYLFTHDSGVEIPLGTSDEWLLKLGLRHDYKSLPAEGRERLDTSYYSRLQLNWQ